MLIVMKKNANEEQLRRVKQFLVEQDFDFHQSTGANRTIIGVIGNTETIDREAGVSYYQFTISGKVVY